MPDEHIICAGFGGQGIMVMGKLIAQAALAGGKEVAWLPSYGAEVRGGTAHCMVTISLKPIATPVIFSPDVCFAMNKPSLLKFQGRVRKGGLLIVNTSLTDEKVSRKDIDVVRLPLTELASKLGSGRIANMIAIGAYAAKRDAISLEDAILSIKDVIPVYRHNLLKINASALKEGYRLANGKL
ncbi:MAG: hypothetical protein AUJ75_04620 [Candidatus Omnitrophica bacterium CG1_02_49_10]|nr:MAG: hypothetical protein AUJ75_04620 [Candidatus Omnitrophica bacterium CG1_02_49_10]